MTRSRQNFDLTSERAVLEKKESGSAVATNGAALATQAPVALSVVVCTLNRCDSLKRSVDALLAVESTHDWELIIVDNGSTDGTSDFLASINQKQFNRALVVATVEEKRGLAAARNAGWRMARADVVSFTDDDCYVLKNYVDAMVQVFGEQQQIGFLGGRILLYDRLDADVTIKESQEPLDFRPWTFIAAGDVSGANMAFRKSVLQVIGGFDERFGAGTDYPCEDTDATAAALWAGIPGVYDPRPAVFHHHGRRTDSAVQDLMASYDYGRGAYLVKYVSARRSRWAYLWWWLNSIRGEFTGPLLRGRLPTMQRSKRELSSGLRFGLQCFRDRKKHRGN